jgi:cytochrome c553
MVTQRSMKNLLISAAIASAVIGACSAAATAQPAESDAEMRTLTATPMDVADGKQLASMSCARCHGADGIGNGADVPSIAGQRPVYLYRALKDYESGARNDRQMREAIKFLTGDALIKVAAYYARLDPAQPPAGPAAPARPDPLQAGKAAAAACGGCHGSTGVSQIPGIPSLIGLYPKYLIDSVKAYKTGERKNDTMKGMVAAVSDKAMANIALFYALQKPARAKTPSAGNAAAGKAAAASCGGCHGEQGVSASPATPSLAGQDAQFLVAAMRGYKDGSRVNETMKGMVGALNETAMKNLAAYYAAQEPKAPNVRKPMTTAEWAERCNRCHGVNGNSTDPRFPMLASQHIDYLRKALRGYRTHHRKSSAMAPMTEALSEDDIENLAVYYAHEKARAVLFVPLPGK